MEGAFAFISKRYLWSAYLISTSSLGTLLMPQSKATDFQRPEPVAFHAVGE